MEQMRFEATTLEGFIQQLAVSFVGKGYFYYATGRVPQGKDPLAIDRKFAERYRLNISKWSRYRRKRAGLANVRYLRYERFFILLATGGVHRVFEDEAGLLRGCPRGPLKFGGYAGSSPHGRGHARIEQEQYNLLKAHLLDVSTRRRSETLERMIATLPFEPYAPVRRQLFNLVRAMNRARKAAGFQPLAMSCVRLKRRIVRPFQPVAVTARPGQGPPGGDDGSCPPMRQESRAPSSKDPAVGPPAAAPHSAAERPRNELEPNDRSTDP